MYNMSFEIECTDDPNKLFPRMLMAWVRVDGRSSRKKKYLCKLHYSGLN